MKIRAPRITANKTDNAERRGYKHNKEYPQRYTLLMRPHSRCPPSPEAPHNSRRQYYGQQGFQDLVQEPEESLFQTGWLWFHGTSVYHGVMFREIPKFLLQNVVAALT
jgi:hypothetical protein